jgi:PKD repeat protein/surface antigen
MKFFMLLVAVTCLISVSARAVDDYPHSGAPSSGVDPWHFFYRQCTSFVAWRMENNNGIDFDNNMNDGHWGNAYNWDDNAILLGYTVNSTAAVGAIAQWNETEVGGGYGHVAWVQSVNADGSAVIEEYNFSSPLAYGTRTVTAPRYIHVSSPVPPDVGYFSDGWHGTTSQAFVDKYNQLVGQGHPLGSPWENPAGGSPYVHFLSEGMMIQDFLGADNGYTLPYTALIKGPDPGDSVRLLKEGFWDHWINNTGWENYGYPVTDEYSIGGTPTQTFRKNGQNIFFSWNGTSVDVEDFSGSPIASSSVTVTIDAAKFTDPPKVPSADGGVYHTGRLVAGFDVPFDLLDGFTYDGFYADVNGQYLYLDQFTVSGNIVIEVEPRSVVNNLNTIPSEPDPGQYFQLNTSLQGFPRETMGGFRIAVLDMGGGLVQTALGPMPMDLTYGYIGAQAIAITDAGDYQIAAQYSLDGGLNWSSFNSGAAQNPMLITIGGSSAPIADFSASPVSGSAPLAVQFIDQSMGDPDSWYWDFGDGSTSSEQHPSHTYTSAGTYDVSLLVSNPVQADYLVKEGYILVTEQLVADFSADSTFGAAPLAIQFTDLSAGNPDYWYWDFGDGTTSNDQHPNHTYNTPGSYDVSLLVSNALQSDYMSRQDYITVVEQVVVDFIADMTAGEAPLTVQFTDLTIGGPTLWAWDFGDGEGECCAVQNPVHTYMMPGIYSVRLDVQIEDESLYTIKQDYIVVSGGRPQPCKIGEKNTPGYAYDIALSGDYACIADFSSGMQVIDVTDPASPSTVGSVFTLGIAYGVEAFADYAYITTLNADLYVLSIADPMNPVILGSENVMYPAFDLAVGNGHAYVGAQYSFQVVDLTIPTSPTLVGTVNGTHEFRKVVLVDGYALVSDGQANRGLQVIDISLPNAPSIVHTVTVGEGGLAVAQYGNYAYMTDKASRFHVVDISDPLNASIVGTTTLPENATCVDCLWPYVYASCKGAGMQVVDVSTPTSPEVIAEMRSSSAEGVVVSGGNAYLADGDAGLTVCETVCTSGVAADFTADVLTGEVPLSVQFMDLSIGDVTSWLWEFGDGQSAISQHPQHIYDQAGDYTVTLTVSNGEIEDTLVREQFIVVDQVSGVEMVPDRFDLVGNAPNPFNPMTRITFMVPRKAMVRIDVFDVQGRIVVNLLDRSVGAGVHSVHWKGVDRSGRQIPSGTYFYRLTAGDYVETKRMTLIR